MIKRISDAKAYTNDVYDLISRYLVNPNRYPDNSQLIVQPTLCETIIDDPEGTQSCDVYDIRQFVTTDREGTPVPNLRHIQHLAKRYYH